MFVIGVPLTVNIEVIVESVAIEDASKRDTINPYQKKDNNKSYLLHQ